MPRSREQQGQLPHIVPTNVVFQMCEFDLKFERFLGPEVLFSPEIGVERQKGRLPPSDGARSAAAGTPQPTNARPLVDAVFDVLMACPAAARNNLLKVC